jgi:pimeloyl-ACP methyl ester carboxylesterase/DNA-binding CsgD family transcriptional regulator
MGDGIPLVCLTGGGGLSHLTREWQYQEQRAWLERLAANYRVIRLDHRGIGLSDRHRDLDLELAAEDIEAVARKEGLKRFALFAQLHSSATAVLYACQHMETLSHLVFWSPFASNREFVESSPPVQAARATAGMDWHTFTEVVSQLALGWADMEQSRRYAAYMRDCATSDYYVGAMAHFQDFNVLPKLAELTTQTLILHRREAAFPTLELVRKFAAAMPQSRLAILEGSAVFPFVGDTDSIFNAIEQFLVDTSERSRPDGLTERELEILTLLASGNSNDQIAKSLVISNRTVERHISNIYQKIGAHNRAEATAYAFRHHLAATL